MEREALLRALRARLELNDPLTLEESLKKT